MALSQVFLALLVSNTVASPLYSPNEFFIIADRVGKANIAKYVKPEINRDITDWLAIGDSFSAGFTADIPDDRLKWWCSRYKMSYPNQMNENPRFPGHSTSRTFVFGACTGGTMQDVADKQLQLGEPDLDQDYPKIGKPQILSKTHTKSFGSISFRAQFLIPCPGKVHTHDIVDLCQVVCRSHDLILEHGTLSISGNDLYFGKIVNGCLYHWTGYQDCGTLLKQAHKDLDDPGHVLEYKIVDILAKVMARARSANPCFQLYVTGYIQFWNDEKHQWDDISWAPKYRARAPLTITLRKDINSLVNKFNNLIKTTVENMARLEGGMFYVERFQDKFDGHRFCEIEEDEGYHESPVSERTWFIHYNTPFVNPDSVTGMGAGTFFDQVNSILIPDKDGKSTEDQIKEVDGDLAKLNPAYKDEETMLEALKKLGQDDVKYQVLPDTWLRVMHPKGSGYTTMSDAVIDSVLKFGAIGADAVDPMTEENPAEAPYAAGTCSLDIDQRTTKDTEHISMYMVDVKMYDNNKQYIGGSNGPQSAAYGGPLHVKSRLEDELLVAPYKDHNGMVYFTLGYQTWNTVDNNPHNGHQKCSDSIDNVTDDEQKLKKYYCEYVCQ